MHARTDPQKEVCADAFGAIKAVAFTTQKRSPAGRPHYHGSGYGYGVGMRYDTTLYVGRTPSIPYGEGGHGLTASSDRA